MKLKTLKEIELHATPTSRGWVGGYCLSGELRTEAIKHYKHFRGHLTNNPNDLVNHHGIAMICSFIKDFFNITEEDLK